jgi:hypothetical protein
MSKDSTRINQLLDQLADANHSLGSRSKASRAIRRELRKLGHWGGLRSQQR